MQFNDGKQIEKVMFGLLQSGMREGIGVFGINGLDLEIELIQFFNGLFFEFIDHFIL